MKTRSERLGRPRGLDEEQDQADGLLQAFVIYCFFDLLIAYLGGERSLLILLHGRPPKYPVFPGNLVWKEVDVSDPYTFLFLKRGVIRMSSNTPLMEQIAYQTPRICPSEANSSCSDSHPQGLGEVQ